MEGKKAVIFAGGPGTRLAKTHPWVPKPLVPVCGKPIILILLKRLISAGYNSIFIAVRHKAETIMDFIKENFVDSEAEINFIVEDEPLGTGGALYELKKFEQTVLALNGDLLSGIDFLAMEEFHYKKKADLTIATHTEYHKLKLGEVIRDEEGNILDYLEKPVKEYRISSGTYLVGPKILKLIERKEWIPFPKIVKKAIDLGLKVMDFHHNYSWIDVNDSNDLKKAEEMLKQDPIAFGLSEEELEC